MIKISLQLYWLRRSRQLLVSPTDDRCLTAIPTALWNLSAEKKNGGEIITPRDSEILFATVSREGLGVSYE